MSNQYHVRHDLKENKIFIRRKISGTEERKVQIFSLKKEFPFLWAGTLNLGSSYECWVSPASKEDVPSWKEGYGIRFLTETSIEDEIKIDIDGNKTRVLFITPHLSTGGCPQYLYKKIETFADEIDAYVVEHDFRAAAYVVQRNRIINAIGTHKFFSLGEDKSEILQIIERVNPEVIHFEEIPETYMSYSIVDQIYTKRDRNYYITETTHSSDSQPSSKTFLPDKFIFCSKYSQNKFESLNIESEVWEYPIENKERPNRNNSLEEMGLDPSKLHILNVGLFTPGKNQGEIFEVARKLSHLPIEFHFVGNQAPNFEHYWGPIMERKPENCKIWGERNDVDKFMSMCDIFYFSSIYELNPLVVKEALSWKMPVLMYNLDTYVGSYDNIENVHFLDPGKDIEKNISILKEIKTYKNFLHREKFKCKIVHIVSEIFSDIEQTSIRSVSQLAENSENIEYTIHYNPPAKEIPNDKPSLYGNSGGLKPGHFGCFEAFRKAIAEDFTDEYDLLVVCERDCLLEKDPEEIKELLKKTFTLMEEENVSYFSFGDKVNLDQGFLQSERIGELPGDFSFLTNKIIGLQFILFNKKGRDFLRQQFKSVGWYGMDIWLTEVYNRSGMRMGILNERVTTQIDGYSIIDNVEKKFI